MPNRSRAVCWTLSQASPGDVVLLAGGRESLGPDNVRLNDEDVTRYWLQHVDQQAALSLDSCLSGTDASENRPSIGTREIERALFAPARFWQQCCDTFVSLRKTRIRNPEKFVR